MANDRLDALWHYYDEHADQARQHENQRERMTALVVAIAAALVGFLSSDKVTPPYQLMASVMLLALGVGGFLFSLKHYERNRMHAAIMGAIRGEIERELAQPGQTGVLALGEIRAAAEVEHYRAFPKPPTSAQLAATSPIAKQRTYYYWAGVPLFVAGLGLWSLLIVVL